MTTAMPDVGAYGLECPTVQDAYDSVRRVHGYEAQVVWPRLLAAAGLTGRETDTASIRSLIKVMIEADPITSLTGRALVIRLSSYEHLTQAAELIRSTS